jgi:hypothetical protein
MKNTFVILTFLFLFFNLIGTSFGQESENLDLRDCLTCRGKADNFSILNVYFSDSEGKPGINCNSDGPNFISILYTSNSRSDVYNLRIIADILKKDSEGVVLGSLYINEFRESLKACASGTCIISIPIDNFGIDCGSESYELSKPLVSWTTTSLKNLEKEYDCGDYPPAQCLNNPDFIPIEVGSLSYNFEPIFECVQIGSGITRIYFVLTQLFGGDPTQEYEIKWNFIFPPDDRTESSEDFSPFLDNITPGSEFTADLKITQGTIEGIVLSKIVIVPDPLERDDIMHGDPIIEQPKQDEDGEYQFGSIEIDFIERDGLIYYWTSVDDPLFYSEEKSIKDLPAGTYRLTTIDLKAGTCRIDEFPIGAIPQPVEFLSFNAEFFDESRYVHLIWQTAKEWENSHFEIERSEFNIKNFKKIGQVEGMGWTDKITSYAFEDKNLPISGGMVYYRLKQVDFNGKFEYSSVVAVNLPKLQFTQGVWRAYPNPTQDGQMRVGLLDRNEYNGESLTFRLIHPTSVTESMTVSNEDEMNEILTTWVPKFPKGLFVVEIRWGQKVEHIKVLRK